MNQKRNYLLWIWAALLVTMVSVIILYNLAMTSQHPGMQENTLPALTRPLSSAMVLNLKLEAEFSHLPPEVKPQEALQRALEVLKRRAAQSPHMLNPQIQSEGERFIRLQVTGVDDLDGAIKRFTQSGVMQVKLVDETHLSSEFVDSSGNTRASKIPAELEVLRGVGGERTVLESRPLLPENCLEYAKVIKTQDGHPAVLFQLNQAGTAAFTEVTTRYIGRKVAIVVNGMTYTVAKISEPISHGQVVIDGLLTLEETEALAASMQTGALPFPVKVVSVQATPISPLQFSMIAMGVRSYSSLVRFFLGLAVFSLALIGWFLVKLGRMGTASN